MAKHNPARMEKVALAFAALSLAAWGCGSVNGSGIGSPPKMATRVALNDPSPREADRSLRYNQSQETATHNSYERSESSFDQLARHRIRALEFDLHVEKAGQRAASGDWFVYHVDLPGLNGTNCERLSDCLASVKRFHDAFPGHEVVTVFLDLKDDLSARGHTSANLDALLRATFDPASILEPRDLIAACPRATTLKDAVTGACAWPLRSSLRGKVVFATTGGTACDPTSKVSSYASGAPEARTAFTAPNVDASCPFSAYASEYPNVVFFNMDKDNMSNAELAHDAGLVSRVYYGGIIGGLDDEFSFAEAKRYDTTFIATNRVNAIADGWAR